MDRDTVVLLSELAEKVFVGLESSDFSKGSVDFPDPSPERLRLAGEFLSELVEDRYPKLDPSITYGSQGKISLALDRMVIK
ncbi:hypothetical protein D3C84_1154660 [compost metagenome]